MMQFMTKSNFRDKVTSLLKFVTRNDCIIFANDIILCLKTRVFFCIRLPTLCGGTHICTVQVHVCATI